MPYLKTIHLKNFQSHRDTRIDLVDGMNAIVGSSDSGKTAIIRGIRWAMYNEPKGDSFVRHGTDHCEVRLIFSDGFTIVRGREKTKNYYQIIDTEGNSQHYEGFGNQIPEEIEKHLGIRRIALSSDSLEELNISRQLDPAFLLHETERVKAEAIGRLSGAYLVDLVLSDLAKEKNQVRRKLAFEKEEKEKAEKELETYNYLEEEKRALEALAQIINQIESKEKLKDQLANLLVERKKIEKQREQLEEQVAQAAFIEKVEPIMAQLEKKAGAYEHISSLKTKKIGLEKELKKHQLILEKTENLDQVQEIIGQLDQQLQSHIHLKDLANRWMKNKEIFLQTEAYIRSRDMEMVEKTYEKLRKKQNLYQNLKREEARMNFLEKERSDLKGKIAFFQEIPDLEDKLRRLTNLNEKKKWLMQNQIILEKNKKAIAGEERRVQVLSRKLENQLINYRDLLAHLGLCPTCHQPLTQEHLNNLLNEMRSEIEQ